MQTAIRIEQIHVDALKGLATRLRLYQTRGAGAGDLPSVSAVIRVLAELADDNEFVEFVEFLLKQKKEGKR